LAGTDPRIREFNQAAQQALAAVQRANAEAKTLQGQIEADAAAERRLRSQVESRAGRGTLVEEGGAGGQQASRQVVSGSEQRARSFTDEEAAQARLNATRREGVATLEAQAQAYRNAARYGPYAGGRKTFDQSGYSGGGYGAPPIPPGGKLPPPGGFPALPAPQKPSVVGSSMDAEAARYQAARVEADSYRLSVSKLAQEQNVASVAMHRHGALTTEFISAAQRGEVTIRELGYQTASTIGKFGGWLVAGSAVYGAFSAISALGRGALEAYSGVNLLSRVVTQGIDAPKLREEFSSLAGEFNLPIETVSEAAYQMGKVFHSQNGALAASKAVLYSVKVGELDVASATRYLIAIVNGFHLPASKMAEVFDQINAAQNRFGISIADVEAGLAKAGGTFHAAGGDFSHLLAIITTAQKATGNTGQTIGTAIARAPNFLRKAANQDVLRQFGIEPGQSIDKVITQAFGVAQTLTGAKLQELAAAIFGPQYGARIGTPLLQQQALYEKVLARTSPQAAKGSAQQELRTQLGGVDEQISKIGVTLERVGGELANAHAFDSFGLLLGTLNETLQLALQLTHTFNDLPDGVKQTLSYALQLAIVMRTLRRFGLGEAIAGGPSGQPTGARGALARVFDSGPIGEAKLFRGGLIEEQKQLEERRASVTTQINKAAGESDAARKVYLTELDRNQVLATQAQSGTEKSAQALERSNLALANYKASMVSNAELVDQLKVQAAYADERLAGVNSSLERTKKRGFFSVNQTLAERERTQGVQFYPTTNERPSTAPVTTGAGIGKTVAGQAEEAARVSGGVFPAEAEQTMRAAEGQVARNATRVGALRGAVGAFGGALNGLLNKIGTIFFGFSIALLAKSYLDSLAHGLEQETAQIESFASNAKQLRQLANFHASGHGSLASGITDFVSGSGQFRGPLGISPLDVLSPGYAFAHHVLGLGASGPSTATEQREAEEQKIVAAQNTLKLQRLQRSKGLPVSFRYASELQKRVKEIERSGMSRKKQLEALEKVEAEADASMENFPWGKGSPKQRKQALHALQQNIEVAKASVSDIKSFYDTLSKLDPKTVNSWMEDYSSLIEGVTGKFNRGAFLRAAAIYRFQLQSLSGSKNPDDLKTLKKDQENFYQAISQAITDEVTTGFELATTPQDRLRVARAAFGHLRAALIQEPKAAVRKQQQAVQEAQENLERTQERTKELRAKVEGPKIGPYLSNFKGGASGQELKQLEVSTKAQTDHLKYLRKDLHERKEYFEQIEKQLRQQVYEAVTAIRDARFQYQQSQTANPLRQAAIEIERVTADLPGAIKAYGRNSQQVFSLLQQREQAIAQQVQSQFSLLQAQGELRAAGVSPTNTLAKDKVALENLQQQLAYAEAHSNRFDPAQIIQLKASVIQAQVQLEQDTIKEATELANARFQIKAARATASGHPVQAAQAAIAQTRFDIAHAQTPLEKLQLESQLIGQLAAKRDAVAQQRLTNIEFETSIGKLSTQQEITALEQLLKDYKLSVDMRRQIREQIHSLKKSGEGGGFDLDVGSITLPTIYDIRRAIGSGIGSNPQVNVTNAPKIVVNNYSSDPQVVGKALSGVLEGPTASALRSAGVK
jgi:TP901 family phage tail tape measure protein